MGTLQLTIALNQNTMIFLFLPDDIENLNMEMIQKIIKQGWSDVPYVVNMINDGRTFLLG